MGNGACRHVRCMIPRIVFAIGVPVILVACISETTSLGGPRGEQSSASSERAADRFANGPVDAGAAPNEWNPPAYSSPDAGRPGAHQCAFDYGPEPASEDCQYLLPTDPQPSPDLDPATWDPRNVRVDIAPFKEIGPYQETADKCGSAHGWYYVPSGDGAAPTTYALCPKSCAVVMDGGWFALAAFGWCGGQ